MRRVNLFLEKVQCDADDPAGYRPGYKRFGADIEATMLGGTIYELRQGESVCPSDKIGVWPGDERDNILVRRESGVDYWDREL